MTETQTPPEQPKRSIIPLDLDLGNVDIYRKRRRLAIAAFGPLIVPAFRSSRLVDDELATKLDNRLYEWIGDTLRLPVGTDIQTFSRRQLKRADRYVTHLADIIEGPYSNILQLLEEVLPTSEHPYQMIHDINYRDTTEQLKFELIRKYILAMIAGLSSARKLRDRPDSNLDVLANRALNLNLWAGHYGEVHSYGVYSLHNDDTNSVTGQITFNPNSLRVGSNSHIKTHRFSLRIVQKMAGEKAPPPVAITHRIKREESVITKALENYFRKGTSPEETIDSMRDLIGLRFIVFGNEAETERFAQRTLDSLEQTFVKVERVADHQPDGKAGQEKRVEFIRYLLTSPGAYELMFYSAADYLNQTYEVGEFVETKGVYTGRAYELYGLRRLMKHSRMPMGVAEWCFPHRRYFADDQLGVDNMITERQHEVTQRLRATNVFS